MEAVQTAIGSWGWEGSLRPLVQAPLPTSPTGREVPWSSQPIFLLAHPHRQELTTSVSGSSTDGEKPVWGGAGRPLLILVGSQAGGEVHLAARGPREAEPGQPCWPSLPAVPSRSCSSFQAAWSPAPARRTTLTPSATPAPVWSSSRPATQAAPARRSRRLRTKARWVRPPDAPSASHGLCPSLSLRACHSLPH